jgi:hypothetical protein
MAQIQLYNRPREASDTPAAQITASRELLLNTVIVSINQPTTQQVSRSLFHFMSSPSCQNQERNERE